MEGILPQHAAAVIACVKGLGQEHAPTSLGYNDMTVMIAYGRTGLPANPSMDANMISAYLGKNPVVPTDARMDSESVQTYLEKLVHFNLIEERREGEEVRYEMRDDDSEIIVAATDRLKSPHIDDLFFHGFRVHCAWQMSRLSTSLF